MRWDDAVGTGPVGRVLTVLDAPGGAVRLTVARVDERGRFWYVATRGNERLESEVVEGTPVRAIVDALSAVRP